MHSFDALYYDIVPDERIVYSYEMHLDDFDDPKLRETGTRDLLEALGAFLAQTPANAPH